MYSDDELLLSAVPDFIRFDAMLKATPVEEGGKRILYFEASNEEVDHQNEVVLQKALSDSAGYFLRHGNIDLSHYTIYGPKSGLTNFMEFEIGRPVDVKVTGKSTFVKAELYQGASPQAKNATMVWESLTQQSPPSRWYPSVGGAVLAKSVKLDPKTQQKVAVVEKVRWNNVALDRCPVNRSVGEVSTAPVGTFSKSMNGWLMAKTLEMGHGTDVAALTGGGALQKQSLDGAEKHYKKFRDRLAASLSLGEVKAEPMAMRKAVSTYGLDDKASHAVVERFLVDLKSGLAKGKS